MGGSATGILGRLLRMLQGLLRPSDLAAIEQSIERATDLLFRLEQTFQAFFRSIEDFLGEVREGRPVGAYGQQERILESTRTLPVWTDVEITWDAAHEAITLLLNLLAELYKTCGELTQLGR